MGATGGRRNACLARELLEALEVARFALLELRELFVLLLRVLVVLLRPVVQLRLELLHARVVGERENVSSHCSPFRQWNK